MLFFNTAGIFDKLFADVEIDQRFPSEKVDFQVAAGPGVFDQKIQSTSACLKAHESFAALELALRREAVFAV